MITGTVFILFSAIISSVHPSMSRCILLYSAIAYALLLPCSLSLDSHYEFCRQNKCGNTSFSFPFGVGNNSCGLPDFQIECVDQLRPVLSIDNNNYSVLQVSNVGRTFTITSDNDLEKCQTSGDLDTSWDSSIFNVITKSTITLPVWRCDEKCAPSIYFPPLYPVNLCSLQELTVSEATTNWTINEERIQNCTVCLKSNGFCGYNIANSDFVCYCGDGPQPKQCPQGKSSNVGVIL
ncbi:hypothetical protein KI387_010734, partial [Taxus chinensis]